MKPWVLAMGLAAAGVGTAAIVLGRRDPERKRGGQMPAPEPSTPISGGSDLMYAGGSPDFDMTGGNPVILRDGESAYQQWKRENAGNDWQLSAQSKSENGEIPPQWAYAGTPPRVDGFYGQTYYTPKPASEGSLVDRAVVRNWVNGLPTGHILSKPLSM